MTFSSWPMALLTVLSSYAWTYTSCMPIIELIFNQERPYRGKSTCNCGQLLPAPNLTRSLYRDAVMSLLSNMDLIYWNFPRSCRSTEQVHESCIDKPTVEGMLVHTQWIHCKKTAPDVAIQYLLGDFQNERRKTNRYAWVRLWANFPPFRDADKANLTEACRDKIPDNTACEVSLFIFIKRISTKMKKRAKTDWPNISLLHFFQSEKIVC